MAAPYENEVVVGVLDAAGFVQKLMLDGTRGRAKIEALKLEIGYTEDMLENADLVTPQVERFKAYEAILMATVVALNESLDP